MNYFVSQVSYEMEHGNAKIPCAFNPRSIRLVVTLKRQMFEQSIQCI